MKTYLILLRGINVGGKNTVSMATLREHLEKLGYANVTTYINSGNVILSSHKSVKAIQTEIESLLPKYYKLDTDLIKVLVLSHEQLRAVVDKRPKGFGGKPDVYHSDAIFLIDIRLEDAMAVFVPRDGVDKVWPGVGVIYSQRLSVERTKSRLGKIIGTPAYKSMTIRSWNTVTKLLALLG